MRLNWIKVLVAGCLLTVCIGTLPVIFGGCSSANPPAAAAPVTEQPAPDGSTLANPAADLDLPPPSALKVPQDIFSDVFHEGADYVEAWPHSAVNKTVEDYLNFRPYFSVAEQEFGLAYAMYTFDVTGYYHGGTINLQWANKGAGKAWIGMADFTRDAWRWYEPDTTGTVVFDVTDCIAGDLAQAVIAVTDTEDWLLEFIYVGTQWAPVITGVSPRHGIEGESITIGSYLKGAAQAGKGTSELLSWSWDFGGGATPNTSTDVAPAITLGNPGVYYCTAIASGLAGDCEHEFLLTVNELGTVWDIEAAENAGMGGGPTSLALDSSVDERAYIGWVDSAQENLCITRFTGTAWLTEQLHTDVSESGFSQTGLALDSEDNPHLAYIKGANIQVDRYFSNLWYTDPVHGAILPGQHWYEAPSLAIDSSGIQHVIWHETHWDDDWASDAVLYSREDGIHWTTPVPVAESGGLMDIDTILASHPLRLAADAPRVCYFDGQFPSTVSYASRNGSWSAEEVKTGVDPVVISMVIDPATGYPHVAYVDKPAEMVPGELVYTHFDGAQWQETILSGAGDVGTYASIALDLAGGPRICYYAALSHDLAWAFYDGSNWQLQVIDQHGDVGKYCSMATGADGRAHISYYDATLGFIKYAQMPEL